MIQSDNLEKIEQVLPAKPEEILGPLIEKDDLTTDEIQTFFINWHQFDDHYLWNCMRNSWHILRKYSKKELNSDLKKLKIYLTRLFRRKKSFLIWEKNRLKNKNVESGKDNKFRSESVLNEILNELKKWIKEDLSQNFEFPIIVLHHKVDAPLKNYEIEDPTDPKLSDYTEKYTLFHNPKTENFHYLHNVQSSINYRTNKAQFHILRVFYPEEKDKEKLRLKIEQKYQEILVENEKRV